MRTPTNIVYVEKEVFDSQAVVHIGLDSRFLVLLLKQGFSYEIVVRRIEKHTKTNLFSITYQTHYFCGFQYEAGHIVAGCNDGKIR